MKDEEQNILGETSLDFIKQSFELKNLKLYKEAIEMLYKALGCQDVGGGALEIISQIGDLYYMLKNYERAIDQYEKALEINKTHAHSLFQLCEIYFIQKKFDLALNLIKELCKNSSELENYIKYFEILYELKKFDEINELYETLDPKFRENSRILYILSLCKGDNKKELLEKIVDNDQKGMVDAPEDSRENNLQAKFDLAVINFNEGNFKDAKVLFEQITQRQTDPKAWFYLGLIENIDHNFSTAINNFSSAIKIEPTNPYYHFELAKSYIEIGWLREAQVCTQKSIELTPKHKSEENSEKYYFLAHINWQNNNITNALINLEQINKNSPLQTDAEIMKNVIRLQKGDLLYAKIELEKLYTQNSKNLILLSALGGIHKRLQNTKKAIEFYGEALSILPDSVEFQGELIDLLIDNKNDEDYKRAEALARDLKKSNSKAVCAYNSLARIYYRRKDYDAAVNELKELVAIDMNNAESYYFMGLILNDAQRGEEAVESLKNAISLAPDFSKYYFQLARANSISGNLGEAFLYAKEACLMEPHEPSYIKFAYEIAQKLGMEKETKFYKMQIGILERRGMV